MKFTDKGIAALKARAERYEIWEDGRTGLGVRVSPKGRKSWVFMYRFGGKARRMGFDTYPAVGLANARVKHAKAKALLEKGIDPGAQEIDRKRAERGAETVADLIEVYLEKWARPRKRSAAEDERILKKEILPIWGRRKAKDITRRDVIELLDDIVDRGSPIQANRTLAVVRKMYNFAIGRDILGTTPCVLIKAPAKENQRDRVLSADEIRTLWRGLDTAPMSEGIKLVLKLQLTTAQRKGEIAGAAMSEFDLEDNVWTIPAERSKNGQAHRVPLSPLALDLINEAQSHASESPSLFVSPWLFPSPTVDGPIAPHSVNRAVYKSLPSIDLANITPHDLRRTAASFMTSLGISRLVVAKILNHVETGVTAVYDRHSYDREKKAALEAWAARLEEIVTGEAVASNVKDLAEARARQ
jgi:integrase